MGEYTTASVDCVGHQPRSRPIDGRPETAGRIRDASAGGAKAALERDAG